jgi:hypothetical protein
MPKNNSGQRIFQSKWIVVGGAILMAMFALGRLGSGLIGDSSSTGDVPTPDCDNAVPWHQAADVEGDRTTVRGPVVDTRYAANINGQPTFLNVGREFPDPERFTVVIWGDVRTQFSDAPDDLFGGREICVAGDVQIYEGSPQIELAGADAIILAD